MNDSDTMMSEFFEVHATTRYLKDNRSCYFSNQQKVFNTKDEHLTMQLFKDKIGASINLALKDKSCCTDDNFLSRFLYVTKFECEKALQLLINYSKFKEQNKMILKNLNIFDESIRLALRDGNPTVLKQRDRRGRKIFTFAAAHWDNKYNLCDIFRAFLLSIDKLLESLTNQALGFVVIVDWTNFTYKQSIKLTPRVLKLFIEGLQECIPAKFKGIHFISQPWYADIALTMIKPFLNEKIKKRIIIHGTNLTTLHDLVSKDVLPPDLGGEGPSVNTLDWYHYLLESSQTTDFRKTYRLIEAEVYAKVPRQANYSIKNSITSENTYTNAKQNTNLTS